MAGGEGPPGRRWPVASIVLAVVAVAAVVGALVFDRGASAEPVGVTVTPTTPVLSARRVPEVLAAPIADRHLKADLDAWLARSPATTCLVVDAGGREAYGHNPETPVTGASTQKLLTATGLLLTLGPKATLDTTAVAAAEPSGGVVNGDLFLVGGGDANLGTPDWPGQTPGTTVKVVHDIDALAAGIARAGVRRITGGVVGDGTRYDAQRYQSSLPSRLIAQRQIGPIGGLMVNDGFAAFSPERSLTSTVPARDTAADAARVLTERLAAHGVAVGGPPRSGKAPAGAVTVATMKSPPLSKVIADMLTTSDNETAESALKEIGHQVTHRTGTWKDGAAGLQKLLTDAGVPVAGVKVVDGTGLSIQDQLTCRALVGTLSRPGTGPVLRNGLAVAGQTGTLADRWVGTPVAGRLRAKTGTLRNVTALAGEVKTTAGSTVTFAYVANVPDPGSINPAAVDMDRLPAILLRYPESVDVAELGPRPPEG